MTPPPEAAPHPSDAPRRRRPWAGQGPLLLNFALFQIAWFAGIEAAARGWPGLGALAIAVVVGWHLARARRPAPEAALVALAMAVGLLLDGALLAAGLVHFQQGQYTAALPPPWMSGMWALLATTLNLSMGWLRGRLWLAAALAAVAGPLSYAAGVRLGAADFSAPAPALAALALGWALAMPLLLWLARRFDGITPLAAPPAAAPERPPSAGHTA